MAPAPIDDDQAVRDAFVRWVAMQPAAPRNAEALIEQLEVSHEYVGLLDTEIHGRRIVWKSVPAAARTRVTVGEVAAGDVDVWKAEPGSLRRRSIHIAACDACAGEKKIRCTTCRGSGKQICGACKGQRKTYGYASNGAYRLLNCVGCRGRGEVDCGHCRRGIEACATCAGEGKLQRWLEIESWQRAAFQAHPPAIATDDAELVSDTDTIPEQWLSLLRPELTADERVVRQRLRVARVPMHCIHYRLGDKNHSVTFTGLRLVPPVTPNNTFDHRAGRLRALRLLLIAIAIAIAITSLARDTFFRNLTSCLSLVALNSALIVIYAFATDWTAARLHASVRVTIAAALLIVAILFAVAALPREAQQLLASGNVDDAEAELRFLNGDALPSLCADVHLARIERTEDIDDARSELVQIPKTFPQYREARDVAALERQHK